MGILASAYPGLKRQTRVVTWTATTYVDRYGDSYEAIEIGYDVLRQEWSQNELTIALIASDAPQYAYMGMSPKVLGDHSLLILGPRLPKPAP